MCAERDDAYESLFIFLFSCAPNRGRKDVHVVAADEVITLETVTVRFELPNAIYLVDYFHLFDSILPKIFGNLTFEKN